MSGLEDGDAYARIMGEVETLLSTALDKLDEINAPADIGAHVDLALCRLRDVISASRAT